MVFDKSKVWFGTQESHQCVVDMLAAKANGTLSALLESNKSLQARAAYDDDEDYRIGAGMVEVVNGVAVISVKGSLVASYAWYNSWYGLVSYEEIRDAMMIAMDDDNVKKILLDVDSAGGSVAYLDEIGDFIHYVDKNVKPVEGHTSSHAHSAGYWLLASCRKITVSRMATTGSIGVIMTMVNYADALEEQGVQYTYVRSGKFKALGQSGEKVSPEALAEAEEFVLELFDYFIAQVLRGRGGSAQTHKSEWVTGKTFLPPKAIAYGLVDEVNSFDGHVAQLFESSNNVYFSGNDTSLSKEAIMKLKMLTASQQARLASGTPLAELGLSTEDLAKAQEELQASIDSENEEKVTDAEGGEGENLEANDEEGGAEASDEETIVAEDTSALAKINAETNKKLARAEIALEDEQAKHTATKGQIDSLTSMQTKLMTIVSAATNKLSVAMGGQAMSVEGLDAAAVVTQYDAAQEKFDATFKVGAASKQTVTNRNSQESLKPNNEIMKQG